MSHIIDFEPVGRRGPCPEGGTLLDAARALGVDLASVCGGNGTCARCRVQVVAGKVTPVGPREREKLPASDLDRGYRLACLTLPLSDCRVHVPPESLTAIQRTQVEGLEVSAKVEPSVVPCTVQMPPPTLEDLRGDDERLCEAVKAACGVEATILDVAVAQQASTELRRLDWQARATLLDAEVIDVSAVDAPWLGLAVDIGTTKIAAYLVDMETGATLALDGITNPQIAYGEDVMSRIAFTMRDDTRRLSTVLLDGINELAGRLCPNPARIVDAVVVGNTAMHHLFLGLPVRQLGLAPYNAVVSEPVDVKARDLGLRLAPGAYVHLLPNVAGFIGADHVAMILATGLNQTAETVIGLDIGTNTEVVLARHGRLLSCSTASGPAFEGGHIEHGIRAVDGAIEKVRIDGDNVQFETVNAAPPIGICGSGVLDAVAALRHAGLVNRRGRLLPHARVRETRDGREFVLVRPENAEGRALTLSEKDIAEILLAKAAIRTGIDALLREVGASVEELDHLVIAGAFGTHIDVASAIDIGMLPGLPLSRVEQVGNAAGVGARQALVSAPQRERAVAVARQIQYLELMVQPDFAARFAQAMYLP